ncbi:APC family permease [Streptomyces akebiae]|uniref:Amino acid permease n=1 Tax=Streptomyces akebiae TaxID=2865673 RepID=A0ABX8XVL3_9ACTN|nr:amino acid permease [Streptomyces akebiae]QYX79579.1 amino acid permease [Streptomyces akebiae]
MHGGRLGLGQGTALYVGAVLGPGVLALPALAAAAAGPASMVSWAVLLLLSIPVAVTFAALGARYPDGGGVAGFVARAFGPRTAACVGWLFYAAVPAGVLAGAMAGGNYVAEVLGLSQSAGYGAAAAILMVAVAANYAGLQVSGRMQLVLVGLLVLLLVCATVLAAPHVTADHFTPFAPEGWMSIGSAALVLFYAFSGWEAASHLSAEFADPRRHLPRATAITLTTVGVLYLGLSVVTIGVLGAQAGSSDVPLMLLLERGVGSGARGLAAAAAVCLSLGAVNTFIAGAARLGAALGRDGALPGWLAKGGGAGQVPRRSLTVQAVLTGVLTLVAALLTVPLDPLMRVTSAFLAAVTVAGMAASLRLLPRRTPLWYAAAASGVFTLVVMAFSGWLLVLPLVVAGCAVLYRRRHGPVTASGPGVAAPAAQAEEPAAAATVPATSSASAAPASGRSYR